MKKMWILIAMTLLLSGCRAVPTFETIQDTYEEAQLQPPREISLDLPEGSTLIRNGSSRLYLWDGYDVTVQVFAAGDLDQTVKTLTGFAPDALTMVHTTHAQLQKYECVWSCTAEDADQVGRAVILDDGCYHYCVTLCAPSAQAAQMGQLWQQLLDCVSLN